MPGSQGWAGDLEAGFYNRHSCGAMIERFLKLAITN
jgi:hypothetical protein